MISPPKKNSKIIAVANFIKGKNHDLFSLDHIGNCEECCYKLGSVKPIDKVCIDRSFELLIRRSIDKLLAKHFCNQVFPRPIRTANTERGIF